MNTRTRHDDDKHERRDRRGLLKDGERRRVPTFLMDSTQHAIALTDAYGDGGFALSRPGPRLASGLTQDAEIKRAELYEFADIEQSAMWKGKGGLQVGDTIDLGGKSFTVAERDADGRTKLALDRRSAEEVKEAAYEAYDAEIQSAYLGDHSGADSVAKEGRKGRVTRRNMALVCEPFSDDSMSLDQLAEQRRCRDLGCLRRVRRIRRERVAVQMTALKRRDKLTVSLDQRIAAFLGNGADTADSGTVAALITEAEAAVQAAQVAAEKEAERALDPLNVDAVKSRANAENIRFECERLTRAIPLLETALHRAREREHAASWEKEYERIEATRDDLAAELSDLYPEFVKRIVDLHARIAKCDRELARLNSAALSGERRRLLRVELKARKLEGFDAANPSIFDKLRLPDPGLSSVLAFPPEQGNPLGLLMAGAAAALATKQAALHSPDWARERERQIAEEQQQADARQAEIDEQDRAKKAEYEKSLVENDRARRVGRRRQEA